jgi:dolichol-phosphate mannosyltransferase
LQTTVVQMSAPASAASPATVRSLVASETVCELSIIIPTFNEAANIDRIARAVAASLDGVAYELIFVDDDSPDGTADIVRELARTDRRVRVIQRIGRRGLSSACIEGMLSSAAPYLAVMDADLQHDETLLPRMLRLLREDAADLVIGTRYAEAIEVPGWNPRRQLISRISTQLGRTLLPAEVSDPMSGFFMLRRETFAGVVRGLTGIGFKILLDILASCRSRPRIVELPYSFRSRLAGESKLDGKAAQEFIMLLLDKTVGSWVPPRFIMFAAVGGVGVGVHLAVVAALLAAQWVDFVMAQAVATIVAMTFNFALNNELTYRDRRLRGRDWLRGWLSFALACSVGAFANVGIAAELFRRESGWVLSALGGIMVGAVWNYAVTSFYTWKPARR